jgi:hypothetical protein
VLFVGNRTRKFDLGEALDTSKQPKLIVVDITSEMWLLQDNDSSKAQVSKFLGALIATLHDLGTMAIGVPRPWMVHGGRLNGAFEFYDGVVDRTLVLIYFLL